MKIKRIMAILGIVIIAGFYVAALVAALVGSPTSRDFLLAALFCTVAVPIMIYAYQLAYGLIKKKAQESKGR